MKKVLLIAAKLLIVALVAWFVRGTLVSAWRQIGEHPLEIHPVWLVLSGAIYLVALLPAGWYWHHVLKTLGQEAGLGETLQAYYLGHLGKYVPGKAMVVILRTGLIRSHRVDTALAVVSVFYETLTMMAVGSFLAVGILAFRFQDQQTLLWTSIGFMLLAGLPTLPPVFRLLLQCMQFLKRKSSPVPCPLSPLPSPAHNLCYKTVLIGWLAMSFVWAGMAASLWAASRACGLEFALTDHFPEYTVAVSLPVVIGFLSFIPGGLVVRDLLTANLLTRFFPIAAAPAAVASGLLRLAWLIAELVVFAILYPLRIRLRGRPG